MATLPCEHPTSVPVLTRPDRYAREWGGGSGPIWHMPLYVDPSARPLLTPFRLRTIRLIQEAADRSLGLPICHAGVFVQANPPGEEGWFLLLTLSCVAAEEELPNIRRNILNAVSKASVSWTDAETSDYSEHIYLELDAVGK